MPKVKVWNDNVHDYKEKFRDENILIKAKSFIEMEEDQANIFRGTFSSFVLDGDGNHTDKGFKMIRIEKVSPTEIKMSDKFTCHVCQYEAVSDTGLDEHVKATHAHLLVKDEAAEADLKDRNRHNRKQF
jgi:hypothetical protein